MKSSNGPSEESVMQYLRLHHPDLADAIVENDQKEDRVNDQSDVPNVPDFKLLRIIGKGGFGVVWLARNIHDCHLYAVKVFDRYDPVELAGIREFKSRAASNPFLVSVSHVGQTDRNYYYVMRLADNACDSHVVEVGAYEAMTLELHVTRTGGLDIDSVEKISTRILLGLERLHESGLAHNDVKPENILRIGGTWQLGDPGLITNAEHCDDARGTKGFRPSDTKSDGRTRDLYALGKTIRFMLTGSLEVPVRTSPQSEQRDRVASCIERACSSDETLRFYSAREMRESLEDPEATVPTARPRANRVALAIGALVTIVAIALAFSSFLANRHPIAEVEGFITSSGARAFPRNNDSNLPPSVDVQDVQEPNEVGYTFEVLIPVTINRLGIWDGPGNLNSPDSGSIGDGLEQTAALTLYNSVGGIVANASIYAGTLGTSDEFAYVSMPQVELACGFYTLSATYAPGGNSFYNAGSTLSPKRGGTAPLASSPNILIKANRWGRAGHLPLREVPAAQSGSIEAYVGPTAGFSQNEIPSRKSVLPQPE